MRITPAVIALIALFALVGCTAPRSGAERGGPSDRYSQGSGSGANKAGTMEFPEGDYRNILSSPGPF